MFRKGAVGFDYGTARWEGEDRKIRTNRLTGPNAGQMVSVFSVQAGGYRFSRTTGQIETTGYVPSAFFGRQETYSRPMPERTVGERHPRCPSFAELESGSGMWSRPNPDMVVERYAKTPDWR